MTSILLSVALIATFCRRPYGKESEFFVQLFLEMDESQKTPSIGDLLDRMFAEQNISFVEVQVLG